MAWEASYCVLGCFPRVLEDSKVRLPDLTTHQEEVSALVRSLLKDARYSESWSVS